MEVIEAVLAEVRALRKQLEQTGVREDLGAVSYKKAAAALDVGLTELKLMVKHTIILSVVYAPGKRPKIPLSEIRRLSSPKQPLIHKQRGKPTKRPKSSEPMSPEELSRRIRDI